MAEPTKPQQVTINFAQDKVKKRRFAAIAGTIVVVFLAVIALKRKSETANPVTRAVEAETRKANSQAPPEVAGPGNTKAPMDQANVAPGADDVFLRSMQDFSKQEAEQKKASAEAAKVQKEQDIQKARMEERQRATAPPSVGADGTPLPAGQQVAPFVPPPPRYDYNTSAWMSAGAARIRPAYQTGELYPSDPTRHKEFEDGYWKGMSSPLVVGLNADQNTAIQRLKQDTAGVKGGLGVRGVPSRQIQSNMPSVRVQRPASGGASHWGGWIVVTPLGPKSEVEAGAGSTESK